MNTYIVNFDIDNKATREAFVQAMKEYRVYCPISKSAWAIKTDIPAAKIVETLGKVVKSEDRVFVVRSGTEASWQNSFGPQYDAWLKAHL
jgi:hypothetical protein